VIQQIIILEGPDGSGKTTLASQLHDRHKFRIVHTGPPSLGENVFMSYAKSLYDVKYNKNYPTLHTVFDRLHLGELVYGPIYRGVDLLGPNGSVLIERIISGFGASVIICLPSYNVCWANVQHRGDNLIRSSTEKKFLEVYKAYEELAKSYQVFDYANQEWEHPDLVMPMPHGFIGSPTPKFLFIGEIANHPSLDFPFMSLSGSSKYLYSAMILAGYQEQDVAFVNAFNLDGKENDLYAGWRLLGFPSVLVLGHRAQNVWMSQYLTNTNGADARISFTSLEHPAYWKRFHANEFNEYAEKLRLHRIGAHGEK
jgi:thymidylate kinase